MTRIVRYDPFSIWRRPSLVDRFFESALAPYRQSALDIFDWRTPWEELFVGDNLEVDVYETDNHLVVETELPGVKPEDISIEERDGLLNIKAESKHEEARQEYGWHIQERRYGAWQRTIRLPVSVNVDKAKAELRDGILSIQLPKEKSGKGLKRIKVNIPKLRLPKLGSKQKRIKVK